MKTIKSNAGFSMIELSITILVIGVLVVGIIKGSKILREAKLKSAQSLTKGSIITSTDDLILWLETSMDGSVNNKPANTIAESAQITSWNDASFNKYVLRSAGSTPPSFTASGIGSLPSIQFDGVDDGLDVSGFNLGANYSVFVVFKSNTTSIQQEFMALRKTGTDNFAMFLELAIGGTFRSVHRSPVSTTGGDSVTSVSAFSTNKNYIYSYIRNYSKSRTDLWLNNTSFISGGAATLGAFDVNNLELAVGFLGLAPGFVTYRNLNGMMSEMIVINRAVKDSERTEIQSYLSRKYDIKLN